jgi:two-component system, chemotaxis family, protein-glutamate methylesterase/glutaminase
MSGNEKIKVMIIDDSVMVRKYISQILGEMRNIEMVGTAPDGKIGYQKIVLYKPDLVILDIEMPEMNGLELLKYVQGHISEHNRPYFIMFSSIVGDGTDETFEALENGAEDFIKKPDGNIADNIEALKKEFDIKIRELYRTREEKEEEFEAEEQNVRKEEYKKELPSEVLFGVENLEQVLLKKRFKPELVAVGSSTGGPIAIRKILDSMENLDVPVIIAQHMPAGFTVEFARNLSNIYNRDIREAAEGEVLKPGTVYICPGGSHAQVERKDKDIVFRIDTNTYEGFFFKPSIDIFFRSIYKTVGKNVLAVVLSGMGRDGAIESVALRKAGALVLAQDKESSVVWGMPKNSIESGGVDLVVDLKDIGNAVNTVIRKCR